MNYKLLFNPFERYQERFLLRLGLVALCVGSGLAYLFNARFDGVLDLHFVPNIELWHPFLDNLINIACLMICLGALSLLINKRTRIVDVLAVSLIARIPYYPFSLFNLNDFMVNISEEILKDPTAIMSGGIAIPQLLILLVFSGLSLLAIVWQLVLLYKGIKVASNGKGVKFTLLFVLAIIASEILSKLLINY